MSEIANRQEYENELSNIENDFQNHYSQNKDFGQFRYNIYELLEESEDVFISREHTLTVILYQTVLRLVDSNDNLIDLKRDKVKLHERIERLEKILRENKIQVPFL